MNLAIVDKIARAVLYEGYMLYPYRPSSVKNRQRWNFGVLYPRSYAEIQNGSDRWWSQTECLAQAGPDCRIEIRVRFLHLISRAVGKLKTPATQWEQGFEPEFELVDRLEVAGQTLQAWQEAEEREVTVSLSGEQLRAGVEHRFNFAGAKRFEPASDSSRAFTGLIIRSTETVSGVVEISATPVINGLLKLRIQLRNEAVPDHPQQKNRDQVLHASLLSAHVVLGVNGGEFISLLEPPDEFKDAASSCQNVGTWPVLVGEPSSRDTMLSSPIILYDYPQIAPESTGDLFDGTEIDEILSLRIMTMTDEEKREMRESDARARQILERTETLPQEQLMKLHGVVRSMRPVIEEGS